MIYVTRPHCNIMMAFWHMRIQVGETEEEYQARIKVMFGSLLSSRFGMSALVHAKGIELSGFRMLHTLLQC